MAPKGEHGSERGAWLRKGSRVQVQGRDGFEDVADVRRWVACEDEDAEGEDGIQG